MSKLPSDMSAVTSVGLDLAKHVFQIHCVRITVPNYGASLLNTPICSLSYTVPLRHHPHGSLHRQSPPPPA